jgi:Family of unknown function (DUF6519)
MVTSTVQSKKIKEQLDHSSGTLQVRVDEGGYTGFENRLYRVEIHDGGKIGEATFKWSRDNGIILTKVIDINTLENKIRVSDVGNLRNFAKGQWIEITDDRHELWGMPGTMCQISDIVNDTMAIDKDTLMGELLTNIIYPQKFHPQVRRWDSNAIFVTVNSDSYSELENGIQAQNSEHAVEGGDGGDDRNDRNDTLHTIEGNRIDAGQSDDDDHLATPPRGVVGLD